MLYQVPFPVKSTPTYLLTPIQYRYFHLIPYTRQKKSNIYNKNIKLNTLVVVVVDSKITKKCCHNNPIS